MNKVKIDLVKLGNLKFPVSFPYLEGWNSELIDIKCSQELGALPNAKGPNWSYPDSQLEEVITLSPEAISPLQ